jgi:glycerophosphoryl diester phosphodiesterase
MSTRPVLLGHRGARANRSIPENTFASFDQAIADGCDGFEFDVRLTADGKAVICHDEKFGQLAIAQTISANLFRLPTLEGVLSRYYKTVALDIELKVPGLEHATLSVLRKHPPSFPYVVSSFLPEVVECVRDMDPGVPLGIICETKRQLAGWQKRPVDYLVLHRKLVSRKIIEDATATKKKVFAWTVNRSDNMRRLAEWGVAGIISDNTSLLAKTLRP